MGTRAVTAVTGPFAARLLELDGFRDHPWPVRLCAPHTSAAKIGITRTHRWGYPQMVGDCLVADPGLVLRHLGDDEGALREAYRLDGIAPLDRVEFALECALHRGLLQLCDVRFRGGSSPGDKLLRQVLARRQRGEPPTESYAETSFVHFLRASGFAHWRQVAVIGPNGRNVHRVDFVLAFEGRSVRRRPDPLTPDDGLLAEMDSREFHGSTFEADHDRQAMYDALGFRSLMVTPTQLSRNPKQVRAAIVGAMGPRLPSHLAAVRRRR